MAPKHFFELDADARYLWAKSDRESGNWHSLLAHMLDVAAVAEALLEQEPASSLDWAAKQFGLPRQSIGRWLAAMVGLHDFGKAIPGFQAKWEAGKENDERHGLVFPAKSKVTDHACATAALKPLATLMNNRRWPERATQAISAHHGFHFLTAKVDEANKNLQRTHKRWKEVQQKLLEAYWQALSPAGAPEVDELKLPAVNWLAGLTTSADWIGSNPDWFPLGQRDQDDLAAYYQHAKNLASKALQQINWPPAQPLLQDSAPDLASLLGRMTGHNGLSPRPLQQAGHELLSKAKGPALLLVEAPMGEGKTELAFLAHLYLQAANDHRGLYVALPTQATGNALFKRAQTFLKAFAQTKTDLQLAYSGAWLNEDMQRLHAVYLKGLGEDNGDHRNNDETLAASTWFSRHGLALLSPYAVGTVDQALFGTLNIKHHFLRLWGLANRVVVLDEVHAYDAYTTGLIEALLRWLKALGSSVVIMSATLEKAKRNQLLQAWFEKEQTIPDAPYPRMLLADDNGIHPSKPFATRQSPDLHLQELAESIPEIANQAAQLLAQGGCGAVIVNTVDRAQQLYRQLRERLGEDAPLLLFHARFPLDERSNIERQVLAIFGKEGQRPAKALLIATQVAEQSLDLDFDFMLSDLAPVDLLLQRAGRLHRHQRPRPAVHQQARLWVAGLGPDEPDLEGTNWNAIYYEYLLRQTRKHLLKKQVLSLPADIDLLVQAVYGDAPAADELDSQQIKAYGERLSGENYDHLQAMRLAIDPSEEPQSAYVGKPEGWIADDLYGLSNETRKGHDSITLIPVTATDNGWQLGDKLIPTQGPLDEATARQLYRHQLHISNAEVVKHFKERQDAEPLFAGSALLRAFHLLPLTQGKYRGDRFELCLDTQLGLVYNKINGVTPHD